MRLEDGFLRWAATDPGLPAVVAGDDVRSYGQLHQQAMSLAEGIGQAAGSEVARVGVFAERGPDAYAAILAVLLAGAAYVPINPGHPPARIARTIELADLDLIAVDQVGLAALQDLPTAGPVTHFDRPRGWESGSGWNRPLHLVRPEGGRLAQSADRPVAPDGPADQPEDTAYLLFTSGTTGDPKGVPISHANVTAFLDHNLDYYRFGPGDRSSQTFDLTFDLSVFDLFMAWGSGSCLYTMGQAELLAPVDFVAQHGLSVWFSVPAVAALQLQRRALQPDAMPSLRTSLFCGEALTVEVAEAWATAAPNSVAENLYGPTELTIACTRHRFAPAGSGRSLPEAGGLGEAEAAPASGLVPIGRPFPAMNAVVVDDAGRSVDPGDEGELCVRGPQKFAGYWRSPKQTAERIVVIGGIEHYRTGDRVRVGMADKNEPTTKPILHFVGRLDGQVQVLGHRVELGEVEAAARSLPGIVDAIAVPLPVGELTTRELGLAVTLVDGGQPGPGERADPRRLRRAIAALLPSYMAPRRVAILDRFPLNANGKIDRGAVAEAAFGPTGEAQVDISSARALAADGASVR